ncbi:MAG: tetratricopeptide repeat protein [Candidatus Peregrinibacteria bacterium]|nr:tetratricopeptide repeat protein [Candidatus Peregrinibacteria bacterium]
MKIPARILAPILAALSVTAVLIGLLWWQLTESSERLKAEFKRVISAEENPAILIADVPVDTTDRSLIHLRQGDLAALQGEWAEAQQEYQLSVDAGGGLPSLRKLAQAQLQRRDTEGVTETIRRLKREGARSEDLLLLESIVDLRSGELVAAQQLLTSAEDSPQKHYGLALLAIIQGEHEVARAELQTVLSGWDPILRSYARTLESAYEEFALFPESSDIHLTTLLSRALAQVQECELAIPLLVQVLAQQDDYRDAWIVQGYCELTTERPDAALTSLERAYSLDPEKPEIQYFLGRTHAALDDHGNAITFYRYALTNGFQPASEIRSRIVEEALQAGDGTLALTELKELANEHDANIGTAVQFVETAIALGEAEQGYTFAREATERWKDEARAFEMLGKAAAATDRKDEAKEAFEKALSLDPKLESAREQLEDL